MLESGTSLNVASHLPEMARSCPDRAAVVVPSGEGWETWTFRELNQISDDYARGLERIGIGRGVRTVLMVKPSLEFFALVFALFKVGAVLVLIDPGMGRRALKACLKEVQPEAFIGVPLAQIARLLFRSSLRSVRRVVTVGKRWFWGGYTHEQLRQGVEGHAGSAASSSSYTISPPQPDDVAAILFTSGSTGIPKGAVYTHGIFDSQVRMLKAIYRFEDGEVDMPTFPLFALFDPALGMTAVIPDMDARFPAKADPLKLLAALEEHRCTTMFGSPALLANLARHCEEAGIELPSLRRVLCAGAPVAHDTLRRMRKVLRPGAQVFTPYGATESLPVCNIGSDEVLEQTAAGTAQGQGICVGRPVEGATLRIIRISDQAIAHWSDELLVPRGEIGELTVKGGMVTEGYWGRPEQSALAKIQEGDQIVHRMGDLGWMDELGRVWMCGRKAHRVRTSGGDLFTVPIERIFDQHPAVRRTALVGAGLPGQQRPVLLVEREPVTMLSSQRLGEELRALGKEHAASARVEAIIMFPGTFPVDLRHNAKINREWLSAWVETGP